MSYRTWTAANGREIPVHEMEDLHLLNSLWGLKQKRLFASYHVNDVRENWITVLGGEALKRGLDVNSPPVTKVPLIQWVLGQLNYAADSHLWLRIDRLLKDVGINEPEIDVSSLDGCPSYCHWLTCGGTPITRSERVAS